MATQGSPAVARHRLRLALRRRREATGRTQSDIARSLDWSLSKLQRIEAGENSISTTDLQALLGQLKVTDPDLISSLVAQARVARSRSRWDEARYRDNLTPATKMLLDFEAAATEIRTFHMIMFPGVIQTPEFAKAVLYGWVGDLSDTEREVRLEVRLERRTHVFDRIDPPVYKLLLDQGMLYRTIGGDDVFSAQLRHLIDEAESGHIKLRIAPFTVIAGMNVHFAFTVLTMDDEDDSILYRENYQADEVIQAPDRVQRDLKIFDQLWSQSFSEAQTISLIETRIADLKSPSDRQPTRPADR